MTDILRCDDGLYSHWCPGCNARHFIQTDPDESPRWDFNGDLARPTFTPSVRVRGGREHGVWRDDWCCHYFIRDGRIEFCGDSTHALAGQTVPLSPAP